MERKPEWLRVRYNQQAVNEVAELMRDLKLNTVCKAANCPNLGECYQKHTATFMILGDICTRNCRFCNVTCGKPLPPDPDEPENVAQAAKKLGLRHVVLTCSTRDDLPDGGAEHFAKTVRAIRALCPGTTVETLTSDMKGSHEGADIVIAAHPDVFNVNIETVKELQKAVRPQAGYDRTLGVLRYVMFVLSLALVSGLFLMKVAHLEQIMFWLFLAGNALYYLAGIALAFVFKDNRAFCKYLCPITVFLKPMSYFSLLRVHCDEDKCVHCGKCLRVCPMNVEVNKESRKRKNGTECILCYECTKACPTKVLH